jgi:hypothetical protein
LLNKGRKHYPLCFVIVLAEILNQKLSPRCFTHRRAHGEKAKKGSTATLVQNTFTGMTQSGKI